MIAMRYDNLMTYGVDRASLRAAITHGAFYKAAEDLKAAHNATGPSTTLIWAHVSARTYTS